MQLNQYLIDTFNWNSATNKKLLEKIKELPDKTEAIKFFSHLINCQYNWMIRIKLDPQRKDLDWWGPLYALEDLAAEWDKSLQPWLDYLAAHTDEELMTEVQFTGYDGGIYAAKPGDIALQLNYHSIHHRAQIQTIFRQQGVKADFVDYIGTKYRKLS